MLDNEARTKYLEDVGDLIEDVEALSEALRLRLKELADPARHELALVAKVLKAHAYDVSRGL